MNTININNSTYYTRESLDINNSTISKNDSISSNDTSKTTKASDEIKINTTSSSLNTLKAYDTFKETCKEYGSFPLSDTCSTDMSYWYYMACDMMKNVGIDVPSFCPGDNNSYLDSIDKIKDFVKNIDQYYSSSPDFSTPCSFTFPDEFFDFCDSFKQKLTERGCN